MNVRTKTSLVIIFTLIIGILLGILIDRTLIQQRFHQRISRMRNPRGLLFMLMDIIQPVEAQRDSVEKIVFRYSTRFQQISQQARSEMNVLMDSLKTELNPILTIEQKKRIEERMNRMKRWKGSGPPPFGRRKHPRFAPPNERSFRMRRDSIR